MSHRIKIVINGKVEMDSDPGTWRETPPTVVQDMIAQGRKAEPWMACVRAAFLEAVLLKSSTTIEASTRGTGWTVSVDHRQPGWAATG